MRGALKATDKPAALRRAVVVTGASSGIGAALCRQLAAPEIGVVVHARHNRAGCDRVAAQIRQQGGSAEVVLGDLATPGVAASLIARAASAFGRLDWLVANAGFPLLQPLHESTRAQLEYAFSGNLFSFCELAQAAQPWLQQSDRPRVVALGSFTAHVFRTDMRSFPVSSASKGALETMVKSLALEWAHDGITVNGVVPGYIRKDAGTRDGVPLHEFADIVKKIPLGRVGEPAEVAAVIRFLLSSPAGYITGQMLHVNGGLI